ncbi:hypothetical protein B296_00012539, partial [Ensete ventricosum]
VCNTVQSGTYRSDRGPVCAVHRYTLVYHVNFNLIIGMMDLNEDLEMVQSPQKLKLTFFLFWHGIMLFDTQEPSYVMLGIEKHEEAPPAPQQPVSPMGEACSRMDLTAIHQILVMTHYRDDEVTNEISFQEWTQQMKDMLEARKRGDFAFRDKDFKTAIECYSQFIDVGTMISPTVYARRSLCHLMCDQADAALRDAMQAQCLYPDWPTAFYMQAVALAKLNMQGDSLDMLQEATTLEEKRQKSGRGP